MKTCFVLLAFVSFPITLFAQMATLSPIQIVDNNAYITIAKDGTYVMDTDFVMWPTTDEGVTQLSLYRIQYKPSREKVDILEAYLDSGKGKVIVDLKTIKDQEIADSNPGLSGNRQITVPFDGVNKFSRVYLKMRKTVKVASIPGVYHGEFTYGLGAMELASYFKITSELPLFYEAVNPNKLLTITQSQKDGKHILEAKLRFGTHALPASKLKTNEYTAEDFRQVPRINVSTVSEWDQFAKNLDKVYAPRMKEPLSPTLTAFTKKLSKLSVADKVSSIRSYMKGNFTYSGRWDGAQSDFIPRSLTQIEKTKGGDCKDLAFLFIKLLNAVGIQADFTFVRVPTAELLAMALTEPMRTTDKFVSPIYFNHAIVRVRLGDKDLYLDPTSPFMQSSRSDLHLHMKNAWVYEPKAKPMFRMELESDINDVKTTVHKDLQGYVAKTDMTLRGSFATYLIYLIRKGTEQKQLARALATVAGFYEVDDVKPAPFEIVEKPEVSVKWSMTYSVKGQLSPRQTSTAYAAIVSWPAMTWGRQDKEVAAFNFDFPLEMNLQTIFPEFYLPNELSGDCYVTGPLVQYSRSAVNSDAGITFKETSRTRFRILDPDPKSEMANNSNELRACQNESKFVLEPKVKGSREQVYFGIPESPAAMEKIKNLNAYGPDNAFAWRTLNSWVASNPKNPDTYLFLGRTLVRKGMYNSDYYVPENLKEAKVWIKKGLEMNPISSLGWVILGRTELYDSNLNGAVEAYIKANKLDPKNGLAYDLAAMIAEKRKNDEHTLAYYRLAQQYAADDDARVSAMQGQVEVYAKDAKTYGIALTLMDKMLAAKPDDRWTLNNVSLFYNQIGEYDRAVISARKALKIKEFGAAKFNLADALGHIAYKKLKADPQGAPKTLSEVEAFIGEARSLGQDAPSIQKAMFAYNLLKARQSKEMRFVESARVNGSAIHSSLSEDEAEEMWSEYLTVRDIVREKTGDRNIASLNQTYADEFTKHAKDIATATGKEFNKKMKEKVRNHVFMAINKCQMMRFTQTYRGIAVVEADGTISKWISEEVNPETNCLSEFMPSQKLEKPPTAPFRVKFESLPG